MKTYYSYQGVGLSDFLEQIERVKKVIARDFGITCCLGQVQDKDRYIHLVEYVSEQAPELFRRRPLLHFRIRILENRTLVIEVRGQDGTVTVLLNLKLLPCGKHVDTICNESVRWSDMAFSYIFQN